MQGVYHVVTMEAPWNSCKNRGCIYRPYAQLNQIRQQPFGFPKGEPLMKLNPVGAGWLKRFHKITRLYKDESYVDIDAAEVGVVLLPARQVLPML